MQMLEAEGYLGSVEACPALWEAGCRAHVVYVEL